MSVRDSYLAADDAQLLAQCEVDRFRASGAGGQKRNKTDSAIRLRHRATGILAQSSESRSQAENRERALSRLRLTMALELREPLAETFAPTERVKKLVATKAGAKTRRTQDYALAVAELFDVFQARDYSLSEVAEILGLSTGALSRAVLGDDVLAKKVGEERAARGMRALR